MPGRQLSAPDMDIDMGDLQDQLQSHAQEQEIKEEDDDHTEYDSESSGDDYGRHYEPHDQLPEPCTLIRSLRTLMQRLNVGEIDVNPEYQREVVWTEDRMTRLINSIMENYYIPPIILNKKDRFVDPNNPDERGSVLVCVDGKQRLSSVRAFTLGLIPCIDRNHAKWYFTQNPDKPGKNRRILSERQQHEFLDRGFVCSEYAGLTIEQEEELFGRVQLGMQLNMGEKMRATSGPWQELAKKFVEDFPAVVSLMKDRTRAKDFQLFLACFSQILEVQHPSSANGVPQLKAAHLNVPKLLKNTEALDDNTRSHLAFVFTKLTDLIEYQPEVFHNRTKTLKGTQSFAPVETVAVSVLISMYGEERNDALLCGDIRQFREYIRGLHTDLRLNHQTWKNVWTYIDDLEAIRGAINGTTTHRPRAQPPPPASSAIKPSPRVPSTARRGRSSGTGSTRPVPNSARHTMQSISSASKRAPVSVPTPSPNDTKNKRPRIDTSAPEFKPRPADNPTAVRSGAVPAITPLQARKNHVEKLNAYNRAPSTATPGLPATPTAPRAPVAPMMLPYHGAGVSDGNAATNQMLPPPSPRRSSTASTTVTTNRTTYGTASQQNLAMGKKRPQADVQTSRAVRPGSSRTHSRTHSLAQSLVGATPQGGSIPQNDGSSSVGPTTVKLEHTTTTNAAAFNANGGVRMYIDISSDSEADDVFVDAEDEDVADPVLTTKKDIETQRLNALSKFGATHKSATKSTLQSTPAPRTNGVAKPYKQRTSPMRSPTVRASGTQATQAPPQNRAVGVARRGGGGGGGGRGGPMSMSMNGRASPMNASANSANANGNGNGADANGDGRVVGKAPRTMG